jgi:pre-rRNA-processing protein IPI1
MPSNDVTDRVESALLYIRAGMTHLATEIRNDALAALEWLLESAKEAVVTCPGGWVKTLKAFISMMGWAESNASTKWTSAAKTSFGKGGASFPRQMLVLAGFLKVGLGQHAVEESFQRGKYFPIWDVEPHKILSNSNPYAYLNLFGPARDEESEMYDERESRQRVFNQLFQAATEKGIESAKKEGGEMGRAAAVLERIMKDSMNDYRDVGEFV